MPAVSLPLHPWPREMQRTNQPNNEKWTQSIVQRRRIFALVNLTISGVSMTGPAPQTHSLWPCMIVVVRHTVITSIKPWWIGIPQAKLTSKRWLVAIRALVDARLLLGRSVCVVKVMDQMDGLDLLGSPLTRTVTLLLLTLKWINTIWITTPTTTTQRGKRVSCVKKLVMILA